MSTPALKITGMRKRYGAAPVLEGVEFEAHAGEVHALLGENGAGKSTLMRILAGVIGADAGQVLLHGQPVTLGSPVAARAAGIRTVFQEMSTITQLTVADNLLFGSEPTTFGVIRRRRRRAAALELLERFGLARIDPSTPVADLGLGDRQLLEVVKALREPPSVLILDEATSALSSADSEWVLEQAGQAARRGAIVLQITHRMAEVRSCADRITVLRGGRSVLSGRTEELDDPTLISAMLGRRVDHLYPLRKPAPGDPVLDLRHIAATGLPGPLDLVIRAGEVVGVGGLQGQGQRELLMAIAGAHPWRDGSGTLLGAPYQPRTPTQAISRGVAYVPEDRQREGLFLNDTVRSNITAASIARFVRRGLVDGEAEAAGAAQEAATVGIDARRLGARVGALSGGNQQKVVLAKALLGDPKVLLLHDCTRGVDVGTKAEIFELMARLAASGTAILFYSSDLSELVHMCDRVAVIVEGRLGGMVEYDDLSEEAILRIAIGRDAHQSKEAVV